LGHEPLRPTRLLEPYRAALAKIDKLRGSGVVSTHPRRQLDYLSRQVGTFTLIGLRVG
jgi:hypothetical protein